MGAFLMGTRFVVGKKEKAVEDLSIGDFLLTNKLRQKPVTSIEEKRVKECFFIKVASGSVLKVTGSTMLAVLVRDGSNPCQRIKKKARDLVVGDLCGVPEKQGVAWYPVECIDVITTHPAMLAYGLDVEHDHSCVADGVLVYTI